MITVHHLNHSRSQRVLWALEELELPYEIVKYERDPQTMLGPPALRAIHPLGKSPVITDTDLPGAALAESGAILEYLVDKAGGKLAPAAGTAAHRDYRYFLHYAEGSLMPILLMRLVVGRIKKAPAPFFVRPIARKIGEKLDEQFVTPNLTTHVGFCAGHLAKQDWFAGDAMSMADIQMSFPMEAVAARVTDPPASIAKFVERIHARPAYKKALERGGPYELLG